ncbi:MAG: AmmeMemoRadiSam system radical SAM enzyme [Chlamydiae bacterium]|nr:MAG: AmmeMemoRadiSam system radical SAM enzyme [Chlamydiota bacterium]
MKTANFWHKIDDSSLQCDLCPHNCLINSGKKGICGVRENINGQLFTLNYFVAGSSGIDPIEKKPLYHFFPGSSILSLGTFGCNFSCRFCQNYTISKDFPESRLGKPNFTKDEIINSLKQNSTKNNLNSFVGLAYTYNEPTIWAETIFELGPAVRNLGLKNIFVTNGFINPKPLEKILEFADAFNIDLKAITDDFYKKLCGARISPVLQTIKTVSKVAHIELTNLVIPTYNDSSEDFIKLRDWIANEIGNHTPVHISRYYPMYKLSIPPTPLETLYKARDILKEKLHYVYIGNTGEEQNTYCAKCGELVIERTGYSTRIIGLKKDGKCGKCGERIISN